MMIRPFWIFVIKVQNNISQRMNSDLWSNVEILRVLEISLSRNYAMTDNDLQTMPVDPSSLK